MTAYLRLSSPSSQCIAQVCWQQSQPAPNSYNQWLSEVNKWPPWLLGVDDGPLTYFYPVYITISHHQYHFLLLLLSCYHHKSPPLLLSYVVLSAVPVLAASTAIVQCFGSVKVPHLIFLHLLFWQFFLPALCLNVGGVLCWPEHYQFGTPNVSTTAPQPPNLDNSSAGQSSFVAQF